MSYRSVHCRLFEHPNYLKLSKEARLVLLTVRLCDQSNQAALFRYHMGVIATQTGYPIEGVSKAFEELSQKEWIQHDDYVIWVINGLKHDPGCNLNNAKHVKGLYKIVENLPKCHIVENFLNHYKLELPNGYPIDSPSIPYRYRDTETERDTESLKKEPEKKEVPSRKATASNNNLAKLLHEDYIDLVNNGLRVAVFINWALKKGHSAHDIESVLSLLRSRIRASKKYKEHDPGPGLWAAARAILESDEWNDIAKRQKEAKRLDKLTASSSLTKIGDESKRREKENETPG